MKLSTFGRLIGAAIIMTSGMMLAGAPAQAQKRTFPGVTDTEIKIGQTMGYSGLAAAYSTVGRLQSAYFKMINDQGGVNGRKINMISIDDGYSPPKTVEITRQLVESDNVSFIFSPAGSGPSASVQKYLNDRKIPQLWVFAGASRFSDYKQWPWTTGFAPTYFEEGAEIARYAVAKKPNGKIGILYQNDDAGKDFLTGFKTTLGEDKAKKMIVSELSFETTDATIDSQIRQLKAAGVEVFFGQTTGKFTSQAIRIASDIGWKPLWLMPSTSSSIPAAIAPAGFDKAQGLIAPKYMKEPADPLWANDPAIKEWREWMAKHYPTGDTKDFYNLYAYLVSQTMVQVFKQCGDDLSRENIMKQALNLNMESSLLLPGLRVSTSPTNHDAVSKVVFHKFEGEQWVPIKE